MLRPPSRPRCLPVRSVLMNCSCVHAPRPVVESGVRFAANDMPHGPACAVPSMPDHIQYVLLANALSTGGNCIPSGWPDRIRVSSTTGPCGVIVFGEWQSWQPMADTRYV